jgi:hypothetical protein
LLRAEAVAAFEAPRKIRVSEEEGEFATAIGAAAIAEEELGS